MLHVTAHAEPLFQRALAYQQAKHFHEAEAGYRQVLQINPQHVEALHLLGVLVGQQRRHDEAVGLLQQAVKVDPGHGAAWSNLGTMLRQMRRVEEAIEAYRQAVRANPRFADTHVALAHALRDGGHVEAAVASYRQALEMQPQSAATWRCLGHVLLAHGRLEEAVGAYERALELQPEHAGAHVNMGLALGGVGKLQQAIAAFRKAVALNPRLVEAINNLGNALCEVAQLDEAVAVFRQAVATDPHRPEMYNNLASALRDLARHDEALACYHKAVDMAPAHAEFHSNLLLAMHYSPEVAPEALAEEHRTWNRRHAQPLAGLMQPHANTRDPARRLRVGYVSPDFYYHAVAPMVLPLIEHHDRTQVEVFCYGNVARADAYTRRFQLAADHWRDTMGLSDQQMAEQIRQDRIDILVDLAGHTAGNRLLVFARKPAPVQVARQGYPNTTGMEAVEYRVTDAWADPPGNSDRWHTEKIVRLPVCNWLYQPAPEEQAAEVVPLGDDQPIVFGCFNAFAKVTEPMLELWARVLERVPGSRVLLKAKALSAASLQQRVREIFQRHGVAGERVELLPWCATPAEHVALYRRVSIALDPYPYHGTTTTCEALWMGVPVVSLAGQTHVSRVGVSLLTSVGLPELVADSPEAYVEKAVALAEDRTRLKELRSSLRWRLQNSPIMNYAAFARHLEAAYRQMWQTWCAMPAWV